MGGHADSFRTPGDADIPGRTFGDHALEIALDWLKAHQSRVKTVGTGVCLPQLGIILDTFAHPASELMDSLVNPLGSDSLEEIQRGLQANHDRKIRRSQIGEAIGFPLVVSPIGRGDGDPKALL